MWYGEQIPWPKATWRRRSLFHLLSGQTLITEGSHGSSLTRRQLKHRPQRTLGFLACFPWISCTAWAHLFRDNTTQSTTQSRLGPLTFTKTVPYRQIWWRWLLKFLFYNMSSCQPRGAAQHKSSINPHKPCGIQQHSSENTYVPWPIWFHHRFTLRWVQHRKVNKC